MPLIDPFDTQAAPQDAPIQQSAKGGLIDPFDAPQSAANDAKNNVASAPQDSAKEEVGGGWLNKLAPFLPEPLGALAVTGQAAKEVMRDPTEAERQQEAQQAGVPAAPQATPFGTQVMSEFTDQPHSKMVAYAKSRFPDMPLDQALQRYGVINNHIVFVGKDGHVYAEDKPSNAANLIGNSPTLAGNVLGGIVGGTLGGAATLTVGGAGSIPGAIVGAGIGAGAGSVARDVIANHLGIEQDKGAGDIALSAGGNAILGSAFESGGQLIGRGLLPAAGRGIGYLANKGQDFYDGIVAKAKGVPHESVNPDSAFTGGEAQETKQAADTLGLPLSKAEITMAKGDIDKEKALRGLPGSSDKFNEADQIRNPIIRQKVTDFMDSVAPAESVPGASNAVRQAAKDYVSPTYEAEKGSVNNQIYGVLDQISKPEGVSLASQAVRDAAKNAIKSAEDTRTAAAKPFYDSAKDQVIPDEVLQKQQPLGNAETIIRNPVMEQLKGDPIITSALAAIRRDPVYKSALGAAPDNSLRVLDQVKKYLDDKIGGALNSGEKGRAGLMLGAKTRLTDALDSSSADYHMARATFQENSAPVNELNNSIIGKIANLDDTNLKSVSSMLFDPKEMDTRVLENAMSVISKQNPDAWGGIVRQHLQSKLESALQINSDAISTLKTFKNTVMGTPRQEQILKIALKNNPDAFAAIKSAINRNDLGSLKNTLIDKIANTGDTQLKTVARTLFDPAESDPKVLQQAMNAIKQQNPDAWNAILRSHIQSQFENMKLSTQNGASFGKSFANQFMGTAKKREMLSMALQGNPEGLENFKLLMRVMPRLGAAGDIGSPTATRAEIVKGLGTKNIYSLGAAAATPFQTLKDLFTKLEQNKAQGSYKAVADAVLNPKYVPEMRAIRKMDPGTKQAAAALSTLITRIGQENASKALDYMPNEPIPMQQQQQTQ